MKQEMTVRGAKYAQGFRASVYSILGPKTPQVKSRGNAFVHRNRWTGRALVTQACLWAQRNPRATPTRTQIQHWVDRANEPLNGAPEIQVAGMAEEVPLRVALGMTGGAYHEAFHGRYSRMDPITLDEACEIILPRWARIKNWAPHHGLLQTWNNVIEDIRIERLGRVEYPGSITKLHDLQDFILSQEAAGRNNIRAHGGDASQGPLSVILSVFRDVGLNYNTTAQRAAMEGYRRENPDAVELVLNGPLSSYLKETINLGPKDDLACIRLAFDILVTLVELSGENDEARKPRPNASDEDQKCPKCGAPSDQLVIRPMSDGWGTTIADKGICTCLACGHQQEVELSAQPEPADAPETDDASNSMPGLGGSDSEESGEGDAEGAVQGAGGDKSDEPAEGKGEDSVPVEVPSQPSSEGEDSEPGKSQPGSKGGGHDHDTGDGKGIDFEALAQAALDAANRPTGMMDNNSALEDALKGVVKQEDQDLQKGEMAWRPYNPSLDEFRPVGPSSKGRDHDVKEATKLLTSVKEESSFLRARLRNIVRAMEMTDTVHGLPKGQRLSQRFLVDSKIALMSGEMPKRSYKVTDEQQDVSMAAAIVIDESASMQPILADATRMLCALVEPLEAIGAKVQASGFRDGAWTTHSPPSDDATKYHRTTGIVHDIFKTFDERFATVKWKFANTRAVGSTPLADGIQFGLDSLSPRKEGHRFLFVITDGEPNSPHEQIVRRQERLAAEAGIHVIGIGIGAGALGVKTLFKHHLYCEDVKATPKLLVAKLNELIDGRVVAKYRGRKVAVG